MNKDWKYYKNKISAGEPEKEVIKEARKDYGELVPDYGFDIEPKGQDIPFNLDREYLIRLIDSKKYKDAKELVEEMKRTYRSSLHWNFIETFEYHLRAAIHAHENVKTELVEAKKEFNQHTITIIAVVVGVITLLGTANETFTVSNFEEGLNTFFSITIAILAVISITFIMNGLFKK